MKHRFLLDENVLYDAFRGVNERDEPDPTARDLVRTIGQNCHTIVVDSELLRRYSRIIDRIRIERSADQATLSALTQLLKNPLKVAREAGVVDDLPATAEVPQEDIPIVRAARYFRSLLVTYDPELRQSVNQDASLGILALNPPEAIAKAQET